MMHYTDMRARGIVIEMDKYEILDKAFNKVMVFLECNDSEIQTLRGRLHGRGYIVSMYCNLSSLFSNDFRNQWFRNPNSDFENKTSLQVMIDDEDGIPKVYLYINKWLMTSSW